jgi:hypothetical protein
METMARKKKAKKFSRVEAVKGMARERIGRPKGLQIVPNRKKTSKEKYKPALGQLLEEGQ